MTSTIKRLIIGACLALPLASFASADTYIGVGLNKASIDADFEDDSDTVISAFFGWKPIELIGIEAGYYDLGNYDDGSSADAYTLAAMATMPILVVDAYVKVGYADTSLSSAYEASANDEDTAFYAIGANLNLPLLEVFAEAQRFSVTEDDEVTLFGVGARYYF